MLAPRNGRVTVLACALAALAGWLFLTGMAPAPLGSAFLEQVRGSGTVRSAAGVALPWRPGTVLRDGDVVAPGRAGRAVVAVGPALRFCVASAARMVLARLERQRMGPRYRVDARLDRGRAWVFVADDSVVTVRSPVGQASFHRAAVEFSRSGDRMRVAALRGGAQYYSTFASTVEYRLSAGEEVLADRALREHQIRAMPHRPLERWEAEMLARVGPRATAPHPDRRERGGSRP